MKKIGKKVTIDQLAIMVQNGFSGVNKRIDDVEGKVDKLDARVDGIEHNLWQVSDKVSSIKDALIRQKIIKHSAFK